MEENQVSASTPPQGLPTMENYITPENLEQLKAQARIQAMQVSKNTGTSSWTRRLRATEFNCC
jgi:hypothetical protein